MKKNNKIHYLIATVLGLGYFPFAPGTAGSLGGLVLCLLLHGNIILYSAVFVISFVAGVISAGKVEAEVGYKDPSIVVIDEFACIFPVFLFVPLNPLIVIIGFILYRLIDIVKIPPMRYFDKMEGGWGIMMDDLIGGIYTNLILQLLIYCKIFTS